MRPRLPRPDIAIGQSTADEFSEERAQRTIADTRESAAARIKAAMLLAWVRRVKAAQPVEIRCLQMGSLRILGLPGDSIDSINKTIKFARSLDLDFAQFYCATPFPGSPLYQTAIENHWIQNYRFETFRQDNAVMNLPGLGPESVNTLRKKAYRSFYMHPRRFFKIIKRMRTGNVQDLIKSGFNFLKWSRS